MAGHRIPYAEKVSNEYQPILRTFIGNCTGTSSCRCNMCLRQSPSLRSLASNTVFHITHILFEFTLTHRTLYQQYVWAAESHIVPDDRLILCTFPRLQCTFVRNKGCDIRKRFHKSCVNPSGRYWYTYTEEYCATRDEAIARLCIDSDEWWCDL